MIINSVRAKSALKETGRNSKNKKSGGKLSAKSRMLKAKMFFRSEVSEPYTAYDKRTEEKIYSLYSKLRNIEFQIKPIKYELEQLDCDLTVREPEARAYILERELIRLQELRDSIKAKIDEIENPEGQYTRFYMQ